MKAQALLVAILLVLLAAEATSVEKQRKFKKARHHKPRTTTTTTTESEAEAQDMFAILEEDEAAAAVVSPSVAQATEEEDSAEPLPIKMIEPCATKHCGAGRVCEVNAEGKAECVCIPNCPMETDPRRKVCTNHNETWDSDCEVYQMRCWCDKGMDQCLGDQYKHVHIEYYGECRDMPECTSEEMDDFPRRMRDWLFNIMRDLADRNELSPHYLEMEREAETNLTRRWTNSAIWKWCDLDGHPHDRSVSRHELFPIRAPLMALEHCIAPFLDKCDIDDDHRITLLEWGNCLQLEEDDLEEKCDEVRESDG